MKEHTEPNEHAAPTPPETNEQVAEPTFGVVAIPEQLRDRVLAYVETLLTEDDETRGYMIGGLGMRVGKSGRLMAGGWAGTRCGSTETAGNGTDIYCAD